MSRNTLIGLAMVLAAGAVWFVTCAEEVATPDTVPAVGGDSDGASQPALLQGADANEASRERAERGRIVRATSGMPRPGKPVEFTGLVVDEDSRPLGGAQVVVQDMDRSGPRTTTDANGRFAFDATRVPFGDATVVARKGDLVATRRIHFRPKKRAVDVGTLVLAPGYYVDVVVRSACLGVPPAEILAQLEGRLSGTVTRATTDADGKVRIGPISEGSCRIFAYAEGCGRGLAIVSLPQENPAPVEIEIESARDVLVTVVEAGTGKAVAGADLVLLEHLNYPGGSRSQTYVPTRVIDPTGLNGKTIIRELSMSAVLTVAVYVAGRPPMTTSLGELQMPVIHRNATELRIELPALRTVRWPIIDSEGPMPDEGTTLLIRSGAQSSGVALPAGGRVESGHVVVDGLLPAHVHALAVTPDGRIARLFATDKRDLGNETSFRAPRTIDVAVSYPDGGPVAGGWVSLRGPGNNPIGDVLPLDVSGHATFRELFGMRVTVYLSLAQRVYGGTAIGAVDLDAGSGTVNATVARERVVTLEITLDGTPGVPAGLKGRTWSGMSARSHPIKVLDRERGTAQMMWQPVAPGAHATIGISAPNWILEGSALKVHDDGSGPIERTLAFVSGGTLDARLRLPKLRVGLVLQRWNDADRTWIDEHGTPVKPDAGGRTRLDSLHPGRYRLASDPGGAVSQAVDVVRGEITSITFDLREEGLAIGRVELPDGFDATRTRILVEGRSYEPQFFRHNMVAKDGSFQVWLSGAEEVVLRAQHPLLIPAKAGGTLSLKTPRDKIVLTLVPGPRITAKLDPQPDSGRGRPPRLLAFRGPVSRDATPRECALDIKNGRLICGSLPAGTWTLWLDVDNFVPLTIENVVVPPSGIDLGTLSMSHGSSLRVTYLVKEGQAPPRGSVWLRALSGPSYLRGTSGSEVVVTGLGAGRYTLQIASYGGVGPRLDEEIEVDGTSTVERIVDLR